MKHQNLFLTLIGIKSNNKFTMTKYSSLMKVTQYVDENRYVYVLHVAVLCPKQTSSLDTQLKPNIRLDKLLSKYIG